MPLTLSAAPDIAREARGRFVDNTYPDAAADSPADETIVAEKVV